MSNKAVTSSPWTHDLPGADVRRHIGSTRRSRYLYPLMVWLGYVVLLQMLRKFPVFAEGRVFDMLEELLLLPVLPAAIHGFRILLSIGAWGRLFLALFALYLSFGALSWIFSSVPPQAAALQFLLELKFPLVILVFVGVGNSRWLYERSLPVIKALLLASIPLAALQALSPGVYAEIFPMSAAQGVFHGLEGRTFARATGVFWFSGTLAFFASITAGLFFVKARVERAEGAWLWFGIAALVLLTTLQRQEITGVILLLTLVFLLTHRSRSPGEKMLVLTLFLVGLAILALPFANLIGEYAASTYRRLGIAEVNQSAVARVIFYFRGFELANQNFPLGAGLGAYAGHAAALFDSPVYAGLGFDSLWWYREGLWMTDTFWPHVYGEAGWLGLIAYLGAIACLLLLLWREYRLGSTAEKRTFALFGIFSVLFMLNVSLTGPVMTTMFPLMLSVFPFSALNRRLVKRKAE